MDKKQRAILYGLAIGDGHISYRSRLKDGKYPYEQAELILGHGEKQREYLEYKANLLHSIFGGNCPKVSEVYHTLKANGKTYKGYRVVKTNPYFRQMHRVLYRENKTKHITGQVLSYCDEVSLALWYMDDGSILANHNKSGEVTSLNFRICTQFLDKEEAEFVVEWLKNSFGIEAKAFLSKGKWDIGGATQATLSLVAVIQDYIHPSMAYKILPAMKFVFRKSARHPNFTVGDDIVQSLGKPKEVEE
jgi:recombination protein RecA